MITEQELYKITDWLRENIWRNDDVMYGYDYRFDLPVLSPDNRTIDTIDIITSLHNLLFEAVTGKRYDYAFHWANKIGANLYDDIFDMEGDQKNEE